MLTNEQLADFRRKVRSLQTGSGDARAIAVIDRLLDAVYPVLLETRVSRAEWDAAIRFLGETDPVMMRAIAWCLGLSQVVEEANSRIGPGATPECIEGPFHRPGAPELEIGAPLHQADDGRSEYLFLEGRVLDTAGRPLAGASLDVWAANAEGTYSFFDPTKPEHDCRGRFRTGADGRWKVFATLPSAYHMDVGPMGAVLRTMGHQPWRPAHVHFMLEAQGHEPLTTQLYFAGDPHIDDDPAIGVKPELVIRLERQADRAAMEARRVSRPFHVATYDFRLQPVA
jgi:hydroxyquinol 1,2-dioxygenase